MIAIPLLALSLSLVADANEPSGKRASEIKIPSILESAELADGLPIALPDEEEAYRTLSDDAEKRRFRTLFWARRDPDPQDFGNPVREALLRRALEADRRFGSAREAGRKSDRGAAYILFGEPATIEATPGSRYQRFRYSAGRLPGTPGVAEVIFQALSGNGDFHFEDREAAMRLLDAARRALVVSPAVSYESVARTLPAPDVSGVEWHELLGAREDYLRQGRDPDFPLPATLNVVRGSSERARVYVDIELSGADIVRPKAGAGDERYVTVAGIIEELPSGASVPLRDLAVLHGARGSVHVRIPISLSPGDYRLTLLAREPILSLFSFRQESFRIPDYGQKGLSTSSLISGREEAASGDLPIDLRAGPRVVAPAASPDGQTLCLLHVYGLSAPARVDFLLDEKPIPDEDVARAGSSGDEVLIASIPARGPSTSLGTGRRLMAIAVDPATGTGTVQVRDLAREGAELPPMASRRATLHDFRADADAAKATLAAPSEKDDPLSVNLARAIPARDGAVGFFVDGSLERFATRAPYQVPLHLPPAASQVTVAAASLAGLGGEAPLQRGDYQEATLRSRSQSFVVRSSLVPVYVTVEDRRRGRFVTGLPREAFVLREQGRAEPITHFERDTTDPVSVAFVIEESRTMAPYLDRARAALADFAASLRDIDQGMVVGFDSEVRLLSDLTRCKGCLVANVLAARHVPAPESGDAGRLMDALEAALMRLSSQDGRKIVLLASGGQDSGSRIGSDRVSDLARRYGVLVYPVGINTNAAVGAEEMKTITSDPGATEKTLKAVGLGRVYATRDAKRSDVKDRWEKRERTPSTLQAMAGASGGRAFLYDATGREPLDLGRAIAALRNELGHQYFIGYYSSDGESKGMRRIDVELPGKDFVVRGRSAYYPN